MKSPATLVVSVIDEQGRHAPAKVQLIGDVRRREPGQGSALVPLLAAARRAPPADRVRRRQPVHRGRVVDQGRPRPGDRASPAPTRSPCRAARSTRSRRRRSRCATGRSARSSSRSRARIDSPGWVAGDFHIHSPPSTDSGLPIAERVISCAAEGLEVAVATDHNYITDYAPVIAASGLDPWLLGIPGMELTTFEMGHFNGYPLKVDPGSTRGGEFVWANQPPDSLFEQLRALAIDPDELDRPGQPSAPGGARLLRAVLRRRGDRRAVHARRHPRRVRAVRRRVPGRQVLDRLRRDRAAHRPPPRGRPLVPRPEPAAAGAVPRSAAGRGPGRRRQGRPAAVPRRRRDLVHDARSRSQGDRHGHVGLAPPARRRAGLRAHDAVRRRRARTRRAGSRATT